MQSRGRQPSEETIDVMQVQPVLRGAGGGGDIADERRDDDKGSEDWASAIAKADAVADEAEGIKSRPPKLDLSQSNSAGDVPLSTLRFSTTSSSSAASETPSTPAGPTKKKPTIRPTLGLVFSLSPPKTRWAILGPAILLSIVCGLFPPYMTELIGKSFQAFTDYTLAVSALDLTPDQRSAAQSALLHSIRNSAIQFLVLAALTFVLATGMVWMWVLNGERVVRTLRIELFKGIGGRDLAWFDLGMGAEEGAGEGLEGDEAESGQGAGGLMGRFTK